MLLLLLIIVAGLTDARSQDLSQYEKHWYMQGGDTLPYRILLPPGYDSSRAYPLVLFLHGRGESGTDNEKQLVHGARLFLRDSNRQRFPAFVVFPQCPVSDYWSNAEMVSEGHKSSERAFFFLPDAPPTRSLVLVMQLLKNLERRYRISARDIYVMGLSMGGMGTFEIAGRMPGYFAAAVPICGGADPRTARRMKKTRWWIFHGAKDDIVLPAFSQQMVEALRKAGARVRFTLNPAANHNSWDPAFAEPDLLPWLFGRKPE